MTSFVDNFNFVWQFVMIISFIAAIIGGFFLKFAKTRKEQILGFISAIQIFAVWGTFFWTMNYVQDKARKEVLNYLSHENIKVSMNGQLLDTRESTTVLNELKKLSEFEGHHSSPTTQTDITLDTGVEKLTLILKEDSENPNEYWVFWNKYRSTTRSEIGRIQTEEIRKTLANNG